MTKLIQRILVFAMLAAAQIVGDVTGIWQGTLLVAGKELRIMVKVSKGDDGGLKAAFYSIDQTPQPIATTITVQGPSMKITIPAAQAVYEGKIDPDGSVVAGNFTQG